MKAVGASTPRYDGLSAVTGRSVYVDDVRPPGLLHVKALRSPHHSARIVRLDVEPAARMPGIHAVITADDVPRLIVGPLEAQGIPGDEPLLADREVRYWGQPIAAIAAESEDAARAGLAAIEIDYETREPFLDVRLALDPEQPQITPDGNRFHYERYVERRLRRGDIDRAFEQADVIIQGVYRPTAIEHCPLETQAAVAIPGADGRLTIHSTTQALYYSMGIVAEHLQVPLGRLKFVGGMVGGGFGGKVDTPCESVAALLAMRTGRPVKWAFSREEEMLCSSVRAAWHIEIADAVTSDGWILGRRTLTLHDAGAYSRLSPYGVNKHTFHMGGAYTIPNLAFNSYVVWTNHVPSSAMRGFGVTSASFAIETHMQRIAEVLGIDSWELRLRNATRSGDITPTGVRVPDPSAVSTLLAAADAAGVRLADHYRSITDARGPHEAVPDHLQDVVSAPRPAEEVEI
jgi:CO/xanthine dehydrogenase Mo-binding subunit